jgi:hypothetical protein
VDCLAGARAGGLLELAVLGLGLCGLCFGGAVLELGGLGSEILLELELPVDFRGSGRVTFGFALS